MKFQEIESAVRKQLPGRKEMHRFLRAKSKYYNSSDEALIIFCGLCKIFINGAQKKIGDQYDITSKEFGYYSCWFDRHIDRVAVVMRCYSIDVNSKEAYKNFSKAFWNQHNMETAGQSEKSGIILSHILSSKREYSFFLKKEESCFNETDFTSFYVFNKAQLVKNVLTIGVKGKRFVELRDFGF